MSGLSGLHGCGFIWQRQHSAAYDNILKERKDLDTYPAIKGRKNCVAIAALGCCFIWYLCNCNDNNHGLQGHHQHSARVGYTRQTLFSGHT
jgi:hypothetical protein